MPSRLLSILVIAALLSACATNPTMVASEMREYVRSNKAGAKLDRFEVRRPYAAVVKSIRTKSEDCLAKSFQHTKRAAGLISIGEVDAGVTHYVPVADVSPKRAEFYTKWIDRTEGDVDPRKATGFVLYVADVTPKGRGAATIDLYYWEHERFSWTRDFIKAWAQGDDPGCPTLTGWY